MNIRNWSSRGAGIAVRLVLAGALLLVCPKFTGAQGVDAQPPSPQAPVPGAKGSTSAVIALLPPAVNQKRLTAKDKFRIYVHQNFGPQNFIFPAIGAGTIMASPPSGYPREWKDGAGAFGRWYGEQLAAGSARRTGAFLAALAMHEDTRYVPSGSRNMGIRTLHAIAFTIVDKTDAGQNTFAFSNFAGAAAGGFLGMGILPNGYNDATHAGQRALRGLASTAVRNVITEYRPEWAPILRKIKVPFVLPEWWTPRHPQRP